MENYDLEEDEVVLYKGKVMMKNKKGETEYILTNYNFVRITKTKKFFSEDLVTVDTFPVNEIKWYKDIPQVLKKGNVVELYFLHEETEFVFDNGSETRKFVNAALKLLTNKNAFERGAEKFKNSMSMVDDSLGIDSKKIVSGAISNGTVGKTFSVIGKGAKVVGQGAKLLGHVVKKK